MLLHGSFFLPVRVMELKFELYRTILQGLTLSISRFLIICGWVDADQSGSFPADYMPICFDNWTTNVTIDGESICLALWDATRLDDLDRIRHLYYQQTDVFVLAFPLCSQESLKKIEDTWAPELRHHMPAVPILLIGTGLERRGELGVAVVTTQQASIRASVPAGVSGSSVMESNVHA